MTDAELDAAESLFRNPPSASIDRELALKVLAHARSLRAPAAVSRPEEAAEIRRPPAASHVDSRPIPPVVEEFRNAPTPPASPAAKKKAK